MNQQSGTIERVKKMIAQSENIVVLLGIDAVIESGGENIWSSRECYRLEEKYHKSPDEMMSVEYYSARRDKFFEFYKNEIISDVLKPAPLYEDLMMLSNFMEILNLTSVPDAGRNLMLITSRTQRACLSVMNAVLRSVPVYFFSERRF